MAATTNSFYEGQDIFWTFNITDNSVKRNISGYKFVVIAKGANGYEAKFATSNTGLTGYGNISITNNTDANLQITATQTSKMQSGDMFIEVKQADGSNYKTIFSDVKITLRPSLTKNITL